MQKREEGGGGGGRRGGGGGRFSAGRGRTGFSVITAIKSYLQQLNFDNMHPNPLDTDLDQSVC